MSVQKYIVINGQDIEINWTTAELNIIKKFVSNAKNLKQMLERNKDAFDVNLSVKSGQVMTFKVKLPDEDNKSILLHNLRPFILENENIYLIKICNFLSREINDQILRDYIKQQKKTFLINNKMQPYHFTVSEDRIINSEDTLKMWLNAYEYHRDEEKIKEIQDLTSFLPFNVIEYFMIDSLLEKTKIILSISNLVSNILNSDTPKIEVSKQCKK